MDRKIVVRQTLIGTVAVITGSAGILGRSVSLELDRSGVRLALIDRGKGRLTTMFPDWVGSPDHQFLENIDLTDEEQVADGIARVVDHYGQIDILVNAAGGYRAGKPFHETSGESWDFMMDLNARTVLNVCRYTIPHMIEKSSGKIVNIASRAGFKGGKYSAAYAASKSAVMRLTESMSAELKHQGINVNAVVPGTIDTPSNREQMPEADFEKWVNPDELARVIRFLVSEDAGAIHGALIPVYGRS
jgi:NAD(P)-dependent dehydrogenase (short-subunit alcohol dehydrogenase family)